MTSNKCKTPPVLSNYFSMKDCDFMECQICKVRFHSKVSTTKLLDHLRTVHTNALSPSTSKSEGKTVDGIKCIPSATSLSCESRKLEVSQSSIISHNKKRAEKCKRNPLDIASSRSKLLINMIVQDCCPISFIECNNFSRFLNVLDPCFVLPSRNKMLSLHFVERHTELKNRVNNLLQSSLNISIAVDVWSMKNSRFLTFTAHFIVENKLHCHVLSTKQLPDDCSCKHLVGLLNSVLNDWSITDKIVTFVAGCESWIEDAVETLEMRYLPCLYSSITTLIAGAFRINCWQTLRSKCKGIVVFFKSHSRAAADLKQLGKCLNLYSNNKLKNDIGECSSSSSRLPNKLKNDIQGQWHTTVRMMKAILDSKSVLLKVLEEYNQNMSATDWDMLEDCVKLLSPLIEIIDNLHTHPHPIASLIIPIMKGTHGVVKKCCTRTLSGQQLKQFVLDELLVKQAAYEQHNVSALATLLDPRFKRYAFSEEVCVSAAIITLVNEMVALYRLKASVTDGGTNLSTKSSPSSIWYEFDREIERKSTTPNYDTMAQLDFRKYSGMPVINRIQGDPLSFWCRERAAMPFLSHLARKYLCVPARACDNKTRLIECLDKSGIKGDYLDMFVFLHYNSKWFR